MVLRGTLTNANAESTTTDFQIDTVLKDNPIRGKRKELTFHRFYDTKQIGPRVILYCQVTQRATRALPGPGMQG